jgi:ABC-type polysaccharide transport system permease subunit
LFIILNLLNFILNEILFNKKRKRLETTWILSWRRVHCQCATIVSKEYWSCSSIIDEFASWVYEAIDIYFNISIFINILINNHCWRTMNWHSLIIKVASLLRLLRELDDIMFRSSTRYTSARCDDLKHFLFV